LLLASPSKAKGAGGDWRFCFARAENKSMRASEGGEAGLVKASEHAIKKKQSRRAG